jgi:hypothetical protein
MDQLVAIFDLRCRIWISAVEPEYESKLKREINI